MGAFDEQWGHSRLPHRSMSMGHRVEETHSLPHQTAISKVNPPFGRCKCKHVVLRGRCPDRKMNFTKLAESYPRKLCHGLAACFGVELGLQPHRRKVCMADIAFCKQRNIGEAANPGPRRARQRPHRSINLEDVEAFAAWNYSYETEILERFL